MISFGSIRNSVRLLGSIDPARQVFGAHDHDYAFAPPLSAAELAALEERVGELPADYRAFVLELGATGAGPYYGLHAPEPVDGAIAIAEQGCGGRSILMLAGPHRGEVWSDWTREGGERSPEAPSFLAWYAAWLDRALLEWVVRAAPRVVLDGPDDPAELEAIALSFELVAKQAPGNAELSRTLGYLHARERRWEDARAAFDQASAAHGDEPSARRHLDVARMFHAMDAHAEAIGEAERGLAEPKLWYSTRDELRDVMERALAAAGRHDEALVVLDARAAERFFSFDLHHRLARERIARGDITGAGLALERAASFGNILARPSTLDERLAASFEPIIAELYGARRQHEAAILEALVEKIRTAN